MNRKVISVQEGTTIYASTGGIGYDQPDRMSSVHFYRAYPGSKVILLNNDFMFNIATYSLEFDEQYIYDYKYESNQSWTTYNHDLNGDTYRQEPYIFQEEVYFRICLKKVDGSAFCREDARAVDNILQYWINEEPYLQQEALVREELFENEINKTINTVQQYVKEDSLVLGILTDTHYVVNGTWCDTAYTIQKVHNEVIFDAIIHLGDLTDGMVSSVVTKDYAQEIISDLGNNNVPVYIVEGNHDTNYFASNSDSFSQKKRCEVYHTHYGNEVRRENEKSYYFVDFHSVRIRGIFICSFDYNRNIKYGFSNEMIKWIENLLEYTPDDYKVIIFSHIPPLAEIHYWSDTIYNGEVLVSILENYKIIAFIHGHNHADGVFNKRLFPIISIGCAKCEYYIDKKPNGYTTPLRELKTVKQELWDTMIITPSENRIICIRFGAGESRCIQF